VTKTSSICRHRLPIVLVALLFSFLCGCQQRESDFMQGDTASDSATNAGHNSETIESESNQRASGTRESPVKAPIYFTSMLSSSGVTFRHTSGNSKEKPFPAANGSGVAAIDIDMDGWLDICFGCGTHFPVDRTRTTPSDAVYRNMRNWRFQDVTDITGVRNPDYTAGIEVGDFNSDGFPDLYITSVGINQLYCNLGDGTFEEMAFSAGVDDARWATSSAFIDFDGDGFLDLYVCNYGKWTLETNKYCGDQARQIRMFCSPTMVESEKDVFYRNRGDGTFEDASEATGIRKADGRGQGVISGDFNGDRRADLYVANDINPNSLLLNTGLGTFDEKGEISGTAYDHRGQAQAGMGLAQGDIDRNGHIDLFVTNYQNEHNSLYENLGNASFLECGLTRIPEGSLPNVGWGAALADFDLDGWLDLVVTNGHTDDNLAELGKEGVYLQNAAIWKNSDGYFRYIHDDCGSHFRELRNGRGLALADFDNDGDEDLVIMHQDDAPALLRNDSPHRFTTTTMRIVDTIGNREGLGAVVSAVSGNTKTFKPLLRMIQGGGSYASASDRRICLASESPELHMELKFLNTSESASISLKSGRSYTILRREPSRLAVYETPTLSPPSQEPSGNVQ